MESELMPLEFKIDNRHYSIPFLFFPIIQLKGDSAAGKSLFAGDFRRLKNKDKRYANSLVIDYNNSELLELIKKKTYDYVLIDNADVLITPETDRFIFDHISAFPKTRYIILGRKMYSCVGSMLGVGTLLRERDKYSGEYYFTVNIGKTY